MDSHIFFGIFYLAQTVFLIFIYPLLGFSIFLALRWLVRVKRSKKAERLQQGRWSLLLNKRDLKIIALMFIFVLIFNTQFYLRQRSEWMGDDNAHLDAKEYYVAGQVLYLYRSILTDLLHPDTWFLAPMNFLQEQIYEAGSKYLPEDDGEIGIWMDTWFVYPYSKKFRIPQRGVKPYLRARKVAPMLVEHLDRSWFAIKNLATKPIADKQMYEQHYLRNFSGMVHYYTYWEGYYTSNNVGAVFRLSKDSKFIQRSEWLITWLEELKVLWRSSEKTQLFLKQHPEIAVMRLVAISIQMHQLLLGRIHSDTFVCDDPFWTIYQNMRIEFVEGENGQPAIHRMRNKKKAKQFEFITLHQVAPKFDWYVFYHYCGIILAGEIDWSDERKYRFGEKTLEESIIRRLDNIYHEQFKKLEEQNHDN